MFAASLRLFKALPVDRSLPRNVESIDAATARKTLPKGFLLAPEVTNSGVSAESVIQMVDQLYGRDTNQLNAAFHKSFAKVRDASTTQLYLEQMLHYLTTYGAERVGAYSEDHVYIPAERLDAPELDGDVRLIVIRGLTKAELKFDLLNLLASGIALSDQTVADVLEIARAVEFTADDVSAVKNREVQVALYDHIGRVPTAPADFLRFLIFKATGKSLVIKNPGTIAAIKANDNTELAQYFDMYDRFVGLERLGEVFYRYKPLFLAFRTNVSLKKYVNRVRRLAVDNHTPLREDYLNSVTARVKRGTITQPALLGALDQANTFRKIRLAYALKFRTTNPESILYRVRNGKSFATEFSVTDDESKRAAAALYWVLSSIVSDLRAKVDGKTVYLPDGLSYALPATEKQFSGNIPSGSSVVVPDNMVVGVHWYNVAGDHTDLDLSMVDADGKMGWDGGWRNRGGNLLYSGDNTTAPKPNGAAEVFHVGATARGSWLMNLNYYNFDPSAPVPFKIVVAKDEARNINSDYVIDPNKVIALAASTMDVQSKTLGLVVSDDESTRFYFTESSLQSGISSRNTAVTEQARKFLLSNFTDPIELKDALRAAGAVFVDTPDGADIDLSLEAVDKSTFISLLS